MHLSLKYQLQLLTLVLGAIEDGMRSIDPACVTAGFTESLTCASCDDLSKFRLDSLMEQCRACCVDDMQEGSKV